MKPRATVRTHGSHFRRASTTGHNMWPAFLDFTGARASYTGNASGLPYIKSARSKVSKATLHDSRKNIMHLSLAFRWLQGWDCSPDRGTVATGPQPGCRPGAARWRRAAASLRRKPQGQRESLRAGSRPRHLFGSSPAPADPVIITELEAPERSASDQFFPPARGNGILHFEAGVATMLCCDVGTHFRLDESNRQSRRGVTGG